MGKPNKKGRAKDGKHVRLDWWLIESFAYRSLSPPARALLIEFKHLYNGVNNGELFLSQRDAAKSLGIKTHATAAKYLQELEEWGFIKTRLKGSFANKVRLSSAYILTEYEYRGRKATKDFMQKKPSKSQKSRIQEIYPAWLKNKPSGLEYLPDDWESGDDNPPFDEPFASADGASIPPTCNIPGQEASNGPAMTA